MAVAPSAVTKTFERLRSASAGKIYLKQIGGRYYVYRESGTWDKEEKKTRVKSEYLGKILDNGTYVKKMVTYSDELEKAKALILERGGNITWPERKSDVETINLPSPILLEASEIDAKLLMVLSMNARSSFASIGKLVGLSPAAAYARVKNLEKEYGIRYVPEIDVTKLGYLQFFLAVKFLDKMPPVENLRKLLQEEPKIQMAMTLKGEFDLLIYVLAKNVEELNTNMRLGIFRKMGDYDCTWTTIPFYETYGFIPIRDEFIDFLKDSLLSREYAVLKELNLDGKNEFGEIDKKYGTEEGRSSYSYHKLRNEGKLRRITISLQKLPLKYTGIIMETLTNQLRFEKNQKKLLCDIIEKPESQLNKYLFVCDTVTPYGIMFFVPVFNNLDLDNALEKLSDLERGMKFTTLIVTNVLFGGFCYRKFDNAYSIQQKVLENRFGTEKAQRMDYEESGRKKAHPLKLDIRGARISDDAHERGHEGHS